jgi:hypothetical protein
VRRQFGRSGRSRSRQRPAQQSLGLNYIRMTAFLLRAIAVPTHCGRSVFRMRTFKSCVRRTFRLDRSVLLQRQYYKLLRHLSAS